MNKEFITYKDMSEVDSTCLFFIKELDTHFFPQPWTEIMWQGALDENHFIDILKIDNQVIGFAFFNLNRVDSFAHLYKILIHPEHRSRHLGSLLFSHAMDELKSMGLKDFFLEVEEFNHSAQAVYKKIGFNALHLKKHFYSDGSNALIMTMSL